MGKRLRPPEPEAVTKVSTGRPSALLDTRVECGRQRGFFVSFGYTKDAHDESAAFFHRTRRIIKLLTVQQILDEEHVQSGRAGVCRPQLPKHLVG